MLFSGSMKDNDITSQIRFLNLYKNLKAAGKISEDNGVMAD